MKFKKRPSKENYEDLVNRIYDVIDEYIDYHNNESWENSSVNSLFGMWQIADSVKNQVLIANDVNNLGVDVDLEKKVNEYLELYNKLKEKFNK